MESKVIHILCTRPLNDELIEHSAGKGVLIDTLSFIETRPVINPAVTKAIDEAALQPASVVITSMNAAEMVINHLKERSLTPDWKIYCLAGNTLKIIRNYWSSAHIAGIAYNASLLADKIIAGKLSNVIFFCGNSRREELPQKLEEQNIMVKEVVVYETIATPHQVEKEYNGILFFSPSAAESFFTTNIVKPGTILFSIGNTTAQAIRNYSANKIVVSEFPGKEEMVEKVLEYFTV